MIANLTRTPKLALNPFLISKLDLNSINFFDFPVMKKEDNKYVGQFVDGSRPADWVIKMHR